MTQHYIGEPHQYAIFNQTDGTDILDSFVTTSEDLANQIQEQILVPQNLQAMIRFFQDCYTVKSFTLVTNDFDEALLAIDANMPVQFDNNDRFDSFRASHADRLLEKLFVLKNKGGDELPSFDLTPNSNPNTTAKIAKKAMVELLKDYPFVNVEQAANMVAAKSKVDKKWALGFGNWLVSTIKNNVMSSKSISDNLAKACRKSWAPLVKIDDYLAGGIWLDRSATGKGKSNRSEKIAQSALAAGKRVAVLCHRTNISDRTFANVDEAVYYNDIKPGTEKDIKCLVIVINSLIKKNLKSLLSSFDVVILEEGKQVIEFLATGTVDNRELVYECVHTVCSNAKSLIMLDADLNDRALLHAQEWKPGAVPHLLSHQADFSDVNINIGRYDQVLSMLSEKATTGQPFMVATDSKKMVDKIALQLKANHKALKNPVNKELRILKIHANTMDAEQKEFIKDPDLHAHKYDVVIYNSCMCSSVSITTPRFDTVFALFSGIITSSNCIQMLRRNRPCKDFYVGLKPRFERLTDDLDELIAPVDTKIERLMAEVEQEENYDRNNIQLAFYETAVEMGFNVSVISDDVEALAHGENFNRVSSIRESIDFKRRMLAASPAASTKLGKQSTTEESDAVEKAHICKATGLLEPSESDIGFYRKSQLGLVMKNIEILRSTRNICRAIDGSDAHKAARDRQKMAHRHEAFNLILGTLGINKYTFTGSYTNEDAAILLDKLYSNRKEFNKIPTVHKLPKNKPTSRPAATVNKILNAVFSVQVTEKREKGERYYSISEGLANLLNGYADNRQKNGYSELTTQISLDKRDKATYLFAE